MVLVHFSFDGFYLFLFFLFLSFLTYVLSTLPSLLPSPKQHGPLLFSSH
jgi:hypothetical protein